MRSDVYAFSARPTRNPIRYALAVWRLIRRDPTTTTPEAAIIEMGSDSPRDAMLLELAGDEWKFLSRRLHLAWLVAARKKKAPFSHVR